MPTRARAAPWSAFVLHRYDWSESSLILDLFTREGGRLAAAAKGAKRPSSQYRAVLLPFQQLHVGLARRATDEPDDVQTLRHAEWAGGSPILRDDALFRGFYLNELVMKLLPRGDAHPTLFDAYAQSLAALAMSRGRAEPAHAAVRAFELTLLRDVGWLPDLALVTATQTPVRPDRGYVLRADSGMVAADNAGDAVAGEHWLRMQSALVERAHDELRHICESAAAPLRSMLRSVLALHLGVSELKTRRVAIGLQRMSSRAKMTA